MFLQVVNSSAMVSDLNVRIVQGVNGPVRTCLIKEGEDQARNHRNRQFMDLHMTRDLSIY